MQTPAGSKMSHQSALERSMEAAARSLHLSDPEEGGRGDKRVAAPRGLGLFFISRDGVNQFSQFGMREETDLVEL